MKDPGKVMMHRGIPRVSGETSPSNTPIARRVRSSPGSPQASTQCGASRVECGWRMRRACPPPSKTVYSLHSTFVHKGVGGGRNVVGFDGRVLEEEHGNTFQNGKVSVLEGQRCPWRREGPSVRPVSHESEASCPPRFSHLAIPQGYSLPNDPPLYGCSAREVEMLSPRQGNAGGHVATGVPSVRPLCNTHLSSLSKFSDSHPLLAPLAHAKLCTSLEQSL